jgi:hypothetical protein
MILDPKVLSWQASWQAIVSDNIYNPGFGLETAWRNNFDKWGYPLENAEFDILVSGKMYKARNFHKIGLVYWNPSVGAVEYGRPK